MNPIPITTIVNSSQVLLNNQFDVDFTFQNTSTTIGFKPFIDVLLPHGITTTDAISIGYWDTDSSVWKNNSDQTITEHPYDSSISIPIDPEGDYRWYYFVSHYSSYGQDQPEITVKSLTCIASESDGAVIGDSLNIKAIPWFRYGTDAEDNPIEDPPIQGTLVTSSITPTLIILNKTNNLTESETATGVNFPFKFTITVDIAENQLIENLIIQDELPDTLYYKQSSTTSTISYNSETIVNNIQNGSITWDYGDITGTSGTDIIIEYIVHVPLKDISDQYIISQSTGSNVLVDTTCTSTYDRGETVGIQVTDDDQLTAKSIAIQKSDTIGSSYIIPGDTITYTKNIQISDYFGFDGISVTDTLSDGQIFNDDVSFQIKTGQHILYKVYNKSSFTPSQVSYVNTLNGDSEITQVDITVDISDIVSDLIQDNIGLLLGGCTQLANAIDENSYNVGSTTMTITYTSQLNTHYGNATSGVKEIDIGDSVSSNVSVSGNNYDFLNELAHGITVNDGSNTWTGVGRVTISKSIYAVNGTIGLLSDIYPEDLVTYRILINMSHQNVQDMILTDYLPPPIMSSSNITNTNQLQSYPSDPAVPPGENEIKYGPTDTYHQYKLPTLSTSSSSNSVKFTYGTYQSRSSLGSQIIDILYTLFASDDPVADGLKLTNQVVLDINNTKNNPIQKLDYTELTINEPRLFIEKGVVVTSGALTESIPGDISFTGIGSNLFSGSIDNTITLNSDSTDNEADKYVKYAIVIKNSGHYEGYDVTVKDIHDSGVTPTSTPHVTDGDGNQIVIANINNLFTGDGVSLGSLTRYIDSSSQTTNIIVITYDAQISSTVNLSDPINNTTTLINYSNKQDGTNFSNSSKKATRYINTGYLTVTKEITAVSENLPLNDSENNTEKYIVIGENIDFKSVVTIPQGTAPNLIIREETSTKSSGTYSGFSLNSPSIVVTLDGSLTADVTNPSPTAQSSGRYHDFDFGNVVNSSNTPQTITIEYEQMATDNNRLVEGYISKSKTRCYYNKSSSTNIISNQTKVYIKEPVINIVKSLVSPTPSYPSKGSNIYYQIDVDTNSSPVRAKNLYFKDTVPDLLSLVTNSSDVEGNPVTVVNKDVIYAMNEMAINQSHNLSIHCQIDDYTAASRIINGANLTYKSLDTVNGRNYQTTGWKYFETRPLTTLEIANTTYDHGLISSKITGAIGDIIRATMKMFIPKGTIHFKDIKLYHNSYLSIDFESVAITPTFGPGDHSITYDGDDLDITPTTSSNYVEFLFNQNVYNNRVSTDGNLDDYVQIVFDFKIKNSSLNQNNNLVNVNHIFTCTNLADNDEGIGGTTESYYIVEPQLVVTKTLTKLPKDENGDIQYKIDITNNGSNSEAFNVVMTDVLPNEISDTNISITLPSGFIDLSSGRNLSFTKDNIGSNDSHTIYVDCNLSNASLLTDIQNTATLKWKSQEIVTDETRSGVDAESVNNYISTSSYDFAYEPMMIYEPSINQTFSVLFEDALDFDFDYEDLVLEGKQSVYKDTSGIHYLCVEFNLMSRGAAFKHAFGIYIEDICKQTGSWSVGTIINGQTVENPESIVREYLGISDNLLSSLVDDRIPLFVDTRKYLAPDDIGYPFSANVNDRTVETPDWIFPSSVKCLIKFTTPYIKTKIKILPYIDVWGGNSISSYTQRQYRITLGDKVDYSQKGFTDYPRAFVTNGTFLTGTDYDYSVKDTYPLFAGWVNTYPDYTDIRTHSQTTHSWRDNISTLYKPIKLFKTEYSEIAEISRPGNKPLPKVFFNAKTTMQPLRLNMKGSVKQSGVVENSITSYTDIISVATVNNQFYCLRENGTVVGTDNLTDSLTNVIKIVPGSNHLFGINSSMVAISTDSELDLSSLTDIYDLAVVGSNEMVIGLKSDNTISIVGSGHSPDVTGWTDIVKLSGSVNYLMGMDCDGNVYLTDMSGNQETIWFGEVIVSISAGITHCLGITKNLDVVQYNQNIVDIGNWENIVYVCAGNSYSIAMDQMGMVYFDGTLPSGIDLTLFYGCLNPIVNNQTMIAVTYY